jgi:hypothetical protein
MIAPDVGARKGFACSKYAMKRAGQWNRASPERAKMPLLRQVRPLGITPSLGES